MSCAHDDAGFVDGVTSARTIVENSFRIVPVIQPSLNNTLVILLSLCFREGRKQRDTDFLLSQLDAGFPINKVAAAVMELSEL